MMPSIVSIQEVRTPSAFNLAEGLIRDYVNWLNFDLSFQQFDTEMATLDSVYRAPQGRLFLAFINGEAVGVAGIKKFSRNDCEVKRMFVRPPARGLGVGQLLLSACIDAAKNLHYRCVKLDSVAFMQSAIKLYCANGFREITAYRFNPHPEARYFELMIDEDVPRTP